MRIYVCMYFVNMILEQMCMYVCIYVSMYVCVDTFGSDDLRSGIDGGFCLGARCKYTHSHFLASAKRKSSNSLVE